MLATMVEPGDGLHVTLTGRGISIDRDVPGSVAAEVVRLLLTGSASSRHQQTGESVANSDADQKTLGELFQEHSPKRNPDKILLIAYHLKTNGRATFPKDDVKSGFRRAGERAPGNFDRDWSWAVRNGWLDGDANAGFYITRTGQRVIEQGFAPELVDRTRLKRPRSREQSRNRRSDAGSTDS